MKGLFIILMGYTKLLTSTAPMASAGCSQRRRQKERGCGGEREQRMTSRATHTKDHTENTHICTGQKNVQCKQNNAVGRQRRGVEAVALGCLGSGREVQCAKAIRIWDGELIMPCCLPETLPCAPPFSAGLNPERDQDQNLDFRSHQSV